MKCIVLALIGSALLASCASMSEAPKSEPGQSEQSTEMSLDKIINEPYTADQ